jgi:hypothetical protein
LPEKEVSLACGSSVVKGMEKTRDVVSKVTSEAFSSLDRLIKRSGMIQTQSGRFTSTKPILTKNNKEEYEYISKVLEDAVHLEHFMCIPKREAMEKIRRGKMLYQLMPL